MSRRSAVTSYYELCKPRVVMLMLLTAIIGMLLAPKSLPFLESLEKMVLGVLGIGLVSSSAAVLNQLADNHVDALMRRTRERPLPQGEVSKKNALLFALLLGGVGTLILYQGVNPLTALLTVLSLVGYAGVYSLCLKRATSQNIVIGGLAGAAPPLLGWTTISQHIDPQALLLVMIIFVWTPPHFWSLALYRHEEYAAVGIPMLPVTHGIRYTKFCIFLYTVLLVAVTVLPFVVGMSGLFYLGGALALGLVFLHYTYRLMKYEDRENRYAMRTFRYSITYLMGLFGVLLVDHFI